MTKVKIIKKDFFDEINDLAQFIKMKETKKKKQNEPEYSRRKGKRLDE